MAAASDAQELPRWRIMKNIVVISLAFMLQFTAFSGAANLQSSINAEGGLGTAALAAIYAGLITSNVFLPALVIKWLGCKWSICISFVTYMPYIAAQMYPRFWTLIPAALLVGFGGGPLWCAKCTYLSVSAETQGKTCKVPVDALLTRFLGVFFMIFQLNQVWGNVISSLVLTSGNNTAAVTAISDELIPSVCGARFLPSADAGAALQPQPSDKIQMMILIYLACMAAASILVSVGVDSIKKTEKQRSTSSPGSTALLAVTLKLLVEPNQLLLVVINIFIGLQQAFFGADFTASFVSCAVGTGTVGFVMMAYGIANALGCVVTGYLAKITGRTPVICVALLSHTGLFLTLLLWRPHAHQSHLMYVIAVVWGLADSIWMVQINAYYGVLFPGRQEAAFANFRLWESVGYIIAYLISPHFRTSTKTYILFVLMFIGTFCYFIVEYKEFKIRKKLDKAKAASDNKGCDNIAFSNID
ncbi:UNC93-like protein [Plutella xylostella]|uniref:UNC93-like protein n=1 Tax=Plutella xylostella TaxID=51655 RepID=UPI002033048B|nr:UNC93-like protein [Plutella xylostella]